MSLATDGLGTSGTVLGPSGLSKGNAAAARHCLARTFFVALLP
jgi:hypothetical protein